MMTGFGVFLMRQFFAGVPDDYIHAARIDGLSEFQIWWKVAMPLVTPALSALAIFTFLGNWTAFLWPLIATNDRELYTLPVGLASFSGEYLTEWELIMAGATIATLPTLARLHHLPTLHHPRRRARRAEGLSHAQEYAQSNPTSATPTGFRRRPTPRPSWRRPSRWASDIISATCCSCIARMASCWPNRAC